MKRLLCLLMCGAFLQGCFPNAGKEPSTDSGPNVSSIDAHGDSASKTSTIASRKESNGTARDEKHRLGKVGVRDFPMRQIDVERRITGEMLSQRGFEFAKSVKAYKKTLSTREFRQVFGLPVTSLRLIPCGPALGGPHSFKNIIVSEDGSRWRIVARQAPPSAYADRQLLADYPLWRFYTEKVDDNTLFLVHVSEWQDPEPAPDAGAPSRQSIRND